MKTREQIQQKIKELECDIEHVDIDENDKEDNYIVIATLIWVLQDSSNDN